MNSSISFNNWTCLDGDSVSFYANSAAPCILPLTSGGTRYRGEFVAGRSGGLRLAVRSPRGFRLAVDGIPVLDEPLYWRSFQRRVVAAALVPVRAGTITIDVEVDPRPALPHHVVAHCPSRNRETVLRQVEHEFPDQFHVVAEILDDDTPTAGFRFLPTQFRLDGRSWQEVLVNTVADRSSLPMADYRCRADMPPLPVVVESDLAPGVCLDRTRPEDARNGQRRFFVPVTARNQETPVARKNEDRIEPALQIVGTIGLKITTPSGTQSVPMPVYETLGRQAPRREHCVHDYPDAETLLARIPEPVTPPDRPDLAELYREAWRMLLRLVRQSSPESGLPGSYISTGSLFVNNQFVWDTSFTAMATAYGYRAIPATASLDVLYSRQHDGGYIHRELDVRDGQPVLYEPDFGPNPPIQAEAELSLYRLTGDSARLADVYPILSAQHRWISQNRRLPDGTYWTTGLANGLDNSPSLGMGYPDLTAQMAQDAGNLATIAEALGLSGEAAEWLAEQAETGDCLNRILWSEDLHFYSTTVPEGGHNPHKVVTGFWPLWAGVVPSERVAALRKLALDPEVFGTHHPLPSLAKDSPLYRADGQYWLGSTWAPTNVAAIKGFQRAGETALARELTLRHLTCMAETLASTGGIWENYSPSASTPGSCSMRDYCWSAAGPIMLLFEVLIGLTPSASERTITWEPIPGQRWGVNRYPLGPATIDLLHQTEPDGDMLFVTTDFPFTLCIRRGEKEFRLSCRSGNNQWNLDELLRA